MTEIRMQQIIKILLPLYSNNSKDLYFKGFIKRDENTITIFVTTFTYKNILDDITEPNLIYGYSSENPKRNKLKRCLNYFTMKKDSVPLLINLIIDGKPRSYTENCILMLYDYHTIKHSETISHNDECFFMLQNLIHKESEISHDITITEPIVQNLSWLGSSMFAQHVYNYFYLIIWLLNTVRRKGKVTIKQRNLMSTIIVDMVLGYLVVELLMFDRKHLGALLLGTLEKLVNLMYSLLKWLMGAPAGLKLNNAFNKMLGKFFLYHVELWWLFLDVFSDRLDVILHVCQYLGYLGFTFQAAIISDMICMATFHSYCIYVYAARLFNIQISGLIALLRLFVGRKYNPLRGGIDSCEYTNQELFVGTVAFTILLLLLPTTLMYYIVFAAFRILSLLVQCLLSKIIYIIQTIPFYLFTLWITRSPKIAGNILIEEVKTYSPVLILKIKLCNKPFQELINSFKPPVQVPKNIEYSNIVSNVFTGKQVI